MEDSTTFPRLMWTCGCGNGIVVFIAFGSTENPTDPTNRVEPDPLFVGTDLRFEALNGHRLMDPEARFPGP